MAGFRSGGGRKPKLSPALRSTRAKFEESKHRRDPHGRFADKPGAGDDAPNRGRVAVRQDPSGRPRITGHTLPGKNRRVTNKDTIEVVTRSGRFRHGQTIQSYIDSVGGDVAKALRRIVREMRSGQIRLRASGKPATGTQQSPLRRSLDPSHPLSTRQVSRDGTPSQESQDWMRQRARAAEERARLETQRQSTARPQHLSEMQQSQRDEIALQQVAKMHQRIAEGKHPPMARVGHTNWNPQTSVERALRDRILGAAGHFGPNVSVSFRAHESGAGRGKLGSFRIGGEGVSVTRTFAYDREGKPDYLDHSFFEVEGTGQSKAKPFLAETVAAYRDMGFKKITVHANIDVGGYAWIKYGFTPRSSDEAMLAAHARSVVDRWERYGMLPPNQIEAVKRVVNTGDLRAMADIRIPMTVTTNRGQREGTAGQAMFVNTNWYGSMRLDNESQMRRFHAYAGQPYEDAPQR